GMDPVTRAALSEALQKQTPAEIADIFKHHFHTVTPDQEQELARELGMAGTVTGDKQGARLMPVNRTGISPIARFKEALNGKVITSVPAAALPGQAAWGSPAERTGRWINAWNDFYQGLDSSWDFETLEAQ